MRVAGPFLLVLCGLLAACANGAPPGRARLDSGIGATGSAGMAGGAAAAPSGMGAVNTTRP